MGGASAVKAAIGHAPVEAKDSEEQGEGRAPCLVQLGGADGEQHESAADKPGTIAPVVDEQSWQSRHSSEATLA